MRAKLSQEKWGDSELPLGSQGTGLGRGSLLKKQDAGQTDGGVYGWRDKNPAVERTWSWARPLLWGRPRLSRLGGSVVSRQGLSGASGRRGVTLAAERRRQNQAPWVQIMRRQISSRHLLEVFSPLEMPHRRGPCLRGGERPVIVHDPKGGRQPLAGGPGHWEFQEIQASRPPSGRDPLGRGSGEGAGRTRPLASSRRFRFIPRGAAKMTYTNRPSQAIPTSPSTP